MKSYSGLILIGLLLGGTANSNAQNLPSYMAPISGLTASTPAETATKDVLALNTTMFELYGDAGRVFRNNILAKHPVILGLFSGAGGRFILYRPGMAPIDAPSVPVVYQLLKSVGHSTMALAEVVGPYLNNPDNKSWRGSMLAYRSRMQSALDGLDLTSMPADWRANNRTILQNNIAFMDDCVAKGVISFDALEAFGKKQAPFLAKNVTWAAQTQVDHWMNVLAGWKTMLGPDWDKAYAASNTIYVARQNNVLFSVLAQFFPSGGNQRSAVADRNRLLHNHPRRHVGIAHAHHRRPLCWIAVLRQLSPHGLRVDGGRRARSHHHGNRQAGHEGVPPPCRSVRFAPVARPGHRRGRSRIDRRLKVKLTSPRSRLPVVLEND